MPAMPSRLLSSGRSASLMRLALLASATMLSGCIVNKSLPLPSGQDAYAIFPPTEARGSLPDFILGPSDTISIGVYNEPELSTPQVRLDVSGNVNFPLVGKMHAAGQTTEEFGHSLESRLKTGGYLIMPQVTVNLVESVSQRVTVDGEVNQPGIYPLTGPTTLIDAMALARGTTRIARTREVAIFRVIDGKQMAAKFDITAIRRGDAPNPALQGNDVVVVGFDKLSAAWRDFLQAAPAFTAFSRPFF